MQPCEHTSLVLGPILRTPVPFSQLEPALQSPPELFEMRPGMRNAAEMGTEEKR